MWSKWNGNDHLKFWLWFRPVADSIKVMPCLYDQNWFGFVDEYLVFFSLYLPLSLPFNRMV